MDKFFGIKECVKVIRAMSHLPYLELEAKNKVSLLHYIVIKFCGFIGESDV
jgi:hypothetical protein